MEDILKILKKPETTPIDTVAIFKNYIKKQYEYNLKHIAEISKFVGTKINVVNDGIEVVHKYEIPADIGMVFDKNHAPLKIGDIVETKMCGNLVQGEITGKDIVYKTVNIVVDGDIYTIPSFRVQFVK